MNSYVELLVEKHRGNGILLDSNLLLLLFFGTFRPEFIGKHKRLSAFRVEDYEALAAIVGEFGRVLTTPNILTEVSNLSKGLSGDAATAYFASFASQLSLLEEQYIPSATAAGDDAFTFFGLTDSVVATLARMPALVLTTDLPLCAYLQGIGLDALNFNLLRTWA